MKTKLPLAVARDVSVKLNLPEHLLTTEWRLEYDKAGWCKAVHDAMKIETALHFPAKHRGLKFVIRNIERLSNAPTITF